MSAAAPPFGDTSSSSSDSDSDALDDAPAPEVESKKRKQPTEDDGEGGSNKEGEPKKAKGKPPKKRKRKEGGGFIDDAAEESGSDDDEDDSDDDEGEEDNNDYERDGFVVDEEDVEEEVKAKKKSAGGLEDSDDDDDEDEEEEDGTKKKKKLKKVRDVDVLDEDDLDLINEARGLPTQSQAAEEEKAREREKLRLSLVKGQNAQEVSKGLFTGDTDDEDESSPQKPPAPAASASRPEKYDEDGLDDFLVDDTGDGHGRGAGDDDDDVYAAGGAGRTGGASAAQLQEHLDIFGTDFMDFMEGTKREEDEDEEYDDGAERRRRKKYREAGVGVALGVDSDEEVASDDDESDDESDDDGDLFGDDGALDPEMGDAQRAEVLKLQREKKRLAKEERRKQKKDRAAARRRARLRRAFEPVQLIEHFCTERDDAIRAADVPERQYDRLVAQPSTRDVPAVGDEISGWEMEESLWIMEKIPAIRSEWLAAATALATPTEGDGAADLESKEQAAVVASITYALRYMRGEKLEPDFVSRYRKDVVASPAVRDNLHRILDESVEWARMADARSKIEGVLAAEAAEVGEGGPADRLRALRRELAAAEERVDRTLRDEARVKEEMEALEAAAGAGEKKKEDEDDDDDDDLFGDDDEDEEAAKEAKRQQKASLASRLTSISALLETHAQEAARLQTLCRDAEAAAGGPEEADAAPSRPSEDALAEGACRDKLWHSGDYREYAASMDEYRQVSARGNYMTDRAFVMDMKAYLTLVKEGTTALAAKAASPSAGETAAPPTDDASPKKKRSRRFDWDYYRTCVAGGLRSVAYQFALPPFRAGIKLADTLSNPAGFSYDKSLPGEDGDDDMHMADPAQWSAPVIEESPADFAARLLDSGALSALAAPREEDAWDAAPEIADPLRGARYVAAMELAHEPRVRRHLRTVYRNQCVLTTRPTAKGRGVIDAFHEYYGLHLLKDKPVRDHFPVDQDELARRRRGLSADERTELDAALKAKEEGSCLQYLKLLRAEAGGDVALQVHLPSVDGGMGDGDDKPWHARGPLPRDQQNITPLTEALERVYLPANGDTDAWNAERRRILRAAILTHLLPQFEAEARRDLRDAAVRAGVAAAGSNLRALAVEGPYRPSHLLGENRFVVPTGALALVGVCSSNDVRDGTFLAAVNGRGELGDHLAIPGGTSVTADAAREKIVTFLMQHRPAAVVVGSTGGVSARAVARRCGDLIAEATSRWNDRNIQRDDEDDEDFEARTESFRMMHPAIDDEDDDDGTPWKCNVDIVDDNVAQLFGRSVRGRKEFPDAATNLKIATATARYAQDPLAELAYAWSAASDAGAFGTETLFLNVHPLQRLLPKPLLLREYERVLCGVTADVGVDVNAAIARDHLRGTLAFVPGLGPRKAHHLAQGAERMLGGTVASRKVLLAKRLLGPVVYNNAAAFLRVRDPDGRRAGGEHNLHPLDDTRCHPDVYARHPWAVKIAVDALELGDGAADDEELAISALRDVMQNSRAEVKRLFEATKAEYEAHFQTEWNSQGSWDPRVNIPPEHWRDKVEELDLEAFAGMIEANGGGKWRSQLVQVKWEFRLPYEDPRKPMEPPSGSRLFKLLTGEDDATLCPGKEVTGKVVKNGDFGSQVRLEGDVPGFIPLRNLADDHVEAAEDVVQVGTVVTALVTLVKMDHMCVDLTLRKEDFKKRSSEWDRPAALPPLDEHFDRAAALKIDQEKDKEREARLEALRLTTNTRIGGDGHDGGAGAARRTGKVTRRACAHPAFRNAVHSKVDEELRAGGDANVGEALIRPSNKSCDSLAIHWMVRPGCIKVVEVLEEDKDTDASIGNRLIVKGEVYESIDELLGRYIAPMNDRVEEVRHHRKFLDMPEDEVDDRLRAAKQAHPSGVFYHVCWSESYPGYVSLRFLLGRTPRHHTLGIAPDGFVWGPKTYGSLDKLMNDFKRNPAGPGAKPPPPPGGSVAGTSVSSSRMGTGGRTPESSVARPSRWGARGADGGAVVPPWGVAAAGLPPPPAGLPPTFAVPPGAPPPAFAYPPPPAQQPPPGYSH
ncbi:hypothetical protein ACHAXT_008970 [Thalassiosira profunda]